MINGTLGATDAEADVEPSKREVSPEETAYAGSLATSERVERVIEARSGNGSVPLYMQGVLAELRRQADVRLHQARTV